MRQNRIVEAEYGQNNGGGDDDEDEDSGGGSGSDSLATHDPFPGIILPVMAMQQLQVSDGKRRKKERENGGKERVAARSEKK